jgi:hypothetical protein
MGNAGIVKFLSLRDETVPFVECHCMGLGIQRTPERSPLARDPDQRRKHARADTALAPGPQDGHAPDVAVFEQPRRSDRVTVLCAGDDMRTDRVKAIPLQGGWNTLLYHEHLFPDRSQDGLVLRPVGNAHRDPGIRAWRIEKVGAAASYAQCFTRPFQAENRAD